MFSLNLQKLLSSFKYFAAYLTIGVFNAYII